MEDKDAEDVGLKIPATIGHRQSQQLVKQQLTRWHTIYGTCNLDWKYYLEGNLSIKVQQFYVCLENESLTQRLSDHSRGRRVESITSKSPYQGLIFLSHTGKK